MQKNEYCRRVSYLIVCLVFNSKNALNTLHLRYFSSYTGLDALASYKASDGTAEFDSSGDSGERRTGYFPVFVFEDSEGGQ